MPLDPNVARLLDVAPRPFLERTLRCVFDSYNEAGRHSECFHGEERYNSLPILRREFLEQNWRGLGQQFSTSGVTAEVLKFKEKGFWYHTRLTFGGSVVMTQNAVGHSDQVVRWSEFRNCYASDENQLYLAYMNKAKRTSKKSLLYAILLHGRTKESKLLPAFACIRFPSKGLIGYQTGEFDLFKEFPEVVAEKSVVTSVSASESPNIEDNTVEPQLLDDEMGETGS